MGALNSWSARVSIAPSRNWTAQYSIGRLDRPEALEEISQWRQTASVEYNRPMKSGDMGQYCNLGTSAQNRNRQRAQQLSA